MNGEKKNTFAADLTVAARRVALRAGCLTGAELALPPVETRFLTPSRRISPLPPDA
jgi:hypothetical protein